MGETGMPAADLHSVVTCLWSHPAFITARFAPLVLGLSCLTKNLVEKLINQAVTRTPTRYVSEACTRWVRMWILDLELRLGADLIAEGTRCILAALEQHPCLRRLH